MISWFLVGLLAIIVKIFANIFSKIDVIGKLSVVSFIAHAWWLYPLGFGLMVYGFVKDWRWAVGIAGVITLLIWIGGFAV